MRKKHTATGIRLEAMALEIPDFPEHPNRVPFSGVLTRLDTPSDRAPSGAAGHRVLLTRAAAERALPSLLGMAVDFAPGLRGHDVRRKIGVITRAEIVSDRLEVGGHLFGKDFPDILSEIRAQRERLGMSYEVTGVRVANPNAAVWVLERVVFTGAAILERSAAAYQATSLAAASVGPKQLPLNFTTRGETMDEKITQTLDLLAQSSRTLAAEFSGLRASIEELRAAQETVVRLLEINPRPQSGPAELETRVEELSRASDELRRQNEALRAQSDRFAAQAARKTVPPQVLTLLAKSGVTPDAVGPNGQVDVLVLDKALEGLPIEQRMAIKSQLARAGALL
ncbi:MAG: hypothetical protein HY234_03715 [Acidobacteria bacterium]|nr:hypothetical protein [Acidobacteriota bacterium]MBI3662144.1 hypothetical protein [Acidobacteriota bacterium]